MQYPLPIVSSSAVTWRDYQSRIIGQGMELIRTGQSPLIEMATGTGKTVTAAGLCNSVSFPVLWIADRIELVRQAADTLRAICNEPVGLEFPGHESNGERIVVASKDSLRTERRRVRLRGRFGMTVLDECHHSAAQSWLDAAADQPDAVRVGLSATPIRHDKRRLKLFDCATQPYRLPQAMADGWLVPFRAKRVRIKSIDLAGVDVVAGDLSATQLRDLTLAETNLTAVATALQQNVGSRPTIVYCVAVDVAERLAELLPRAVAVSQRTHPDKRRAAFEAFGKTVQYLVNVAIATEGTDLPDAACIAMYRPTMSQPLFQQMLGRGTRPARGITGEVAAARQHWIATSVKPDCLVLDFVGNAGRHSVCTVAAAFTADKEVAAKVAERLDAGEEILASDAVAEEEVKANGRQKEEKERAKLRLRITAEAEDIALLGLGGKEWAAEADLTGAPTMAQLSTARALGITGKLETRGAARAAIVEARKVKGLASPGMCAFVAKHYPKEDVVTLTAKKARVLQFKKLRLWGKA